MAGHKKPKPTPLAGADAPPSEESFDKKSHRLQKAIDDATKAPHDDLPQWRLDVENARIALARHRQCSLSQIPKVDPPK